LKDVLSSSWTFWPAPDPDVFGDKVYSWKFLLTVNLPLVLAFYSLIVFTPLRAWMGVNPSILAAGGLIQLGTFAGVLAYGYRRIHPGLRELLTYGGNLAGTLALNVSTPKPLFILWILYFLVVFFEAFGNPKAVAAFALTVIAPALSLLAFVGVPEARENAILTALSTGIGAVIYLLAAYVAGWTREGALEKAARAHLKGALEERSRLAHSLDETLGSALAEISLWHEVALATDVAGAQNASLAKARTRAREALTELRELAAGIDRQPASMAGLAGEIQRRAGNRCAAAGIAFEFRIGSVGPITLRDSYHTAMIAIEAVENAVLHAKPRSVSVSLSASPLEVTVEDDGVGFDLTAVHPGRGMRNFEELASALNAKLDLVSVPGKGTRLHVRTAA